MITQPMGVGVRKEDFDKVIELQAQKDETLERQAIQQAARFLEELQKNPIVSLLVSEMESTMMRVYLESPDGQAQWRLFEKLQMGVEPSIIAKNLIRRQMVTKIRNLLEPQATP